MTLVVGLDLSSTSTGLCAGGACSTLAPKGKLHDRARAMADQLQPTLLSADLVVAEAIGTKHVNTAIAIATVHALVWDRIANRIGPRVVLVSPTELKKFATGKGNANKDVVLAGAIRSGSPAENNDEADAWWLWVLGRALGGGWHVQETAFRLAVLAAITKDKS